MTKTSILRNIPHYVFTLLLLTFSHEIYAIDSILSLNNKVNFNEILKFAELANIAYAEEIQISKKADEFNYKLTKYKSIPGEEVSFFLLSNDETQEQIIVTRGTANLENVMVDMAFNLVPNQNLGISLHQGFSSSATKIFQLLKPSLKKEYQIHTTGHSLGGAIAVILAMFLSDEGYKIKDVITFGQPKVTNVSGVNKYNKLNIIRIVTEKDLVPLVPPVDISDIYNINLYWHQGNEIILMGNNQFARLQGFKSMLRVATFLTNQFSQEQIQQHSMVNYLSALKQMKSQTEEVTLEINVNPLKLFGLDNN